MLPYDLFSIHELNEVSKIFHMGFILTVFGFMKANTVYEHEYYTKMKGEEEAASLREDKMTEY